MMHNMTHSTDLDGMASSALLVRNFGMKPSNVIFANYSGDDFEQSIKSVSKIKGSGHLLIITDFALEGANIKKMETVLLKFKKGGNHVIWLDHHPWSDEAISSAKKYCDLMLVGENIDYCATELVYKVLCKRDKYSDELARITHLADFWLKSKSKRDNELVVKISFGMKHIRSYQDWRERMQNFVSELARGNLDNAIINKAYTEYAKITRPLLKQMLHDSFIFTINGIKFGVGFGETISSQEACTEILDKKRCDVSIYISSDSLHGSIRSNRDSKSWGLDIVELAKSMEGGGHPLAAGFTLEHSSHQARTDAAKEKIVDQIKSTAEKLYSGRLLYFQQTTGKTKIVSRK